MIVTLLGLGRFKGKLSQPFDFFSDWRQRECLKTSLITETIPLSLIQIYAWQTYPTVDKVSPSFNVWSSMSRRMMTRDNTSVNLKVNLVEIGARLKFNMASGC